MNWTRVVLAILAAGLIASFTDWLFMGMLFHDRYLTYPEVWRKKPGEPDKALVAGSQLIGLISCAAFVLVCARLGFHTWSASLKLAAAVWAMGPLPILIQNGMWMKIHPQVTGAHVTGWLVRLLICAAAFMWIVG